MNIGKLIDSALKAVLLFAAIAVFCSISAILFLAFGLYPGYTFLLLFFFAFTTAMFYTLG